MSTKHDLQQMAIEVPFDWDPKKPFAKIDGTVVCVIATKDGKVFNFTGKTIPGVARVVLRQKSENPGKELIEFLVETTSSVLVTETGDWLSEIYTWAEFQALFQASLPQLAHDKIRNFIVEVWPVLEESLHDMRTPSFKKAFLKKSSLAWEWSNQKMADREPLCLVVDHLGMVHEFIGTPIDGLVEILSWSVRHDSSDLYECESPNNVQVYTCFAYENNRFWNVNSWKELYDAFWLHVPQASVVGIKSFVAEKFPELAAELDKN